MVLSALKTLFSGNRQETALAPEFNAPLAPEEPFYAVGDIHGRDDLLEAVLERLEITTAAAPRPLVFLGDYIDRGMGSAAVLTRLHELAKAHPERVICLMGNHERMLLEFIDDPMGRGLRWLRNGGVQTLASFGLSGVSPKAEVEALMEVADAFEAALPEGIQQWLRQMPLQWRSGNVVCVHAAMNPAQAPEDQERRTLQWGHKDFFSSPREDGIWVVHGHTIVREPQILGGRISVDTGAYQTGRLTVADIRAGGCRFL